jgi:hypothetical protein
MNRPEIADALDCGCATAQRMRERFSRQRLGTIERKKPDRLYARKLNYIVEAYIIV